MTKSVFEIRFHPLNWYDEGRQRLVFYFRFPATHNRRVYASEALMMVRAELQARRWAEAYIDAVHGFEGVDEFFPGQIGPVRLSPSASTTAFTNASRLTNLG
jgi:hypothetical protein